MEAADFSGYATKAGLKCSDGRTITPQAFAHQDGVKVPLVWQHGHDTPSNILGHVLLKDVGDGVRAFGFFNNTSSGQNAKGLVEHGDISSLSIYANQLVEKTKQVLHGMITEVSLVLRGANPGALIDYVKIQHGDSIEDVETLEDEAIIFTGEELKHGDNIDSLTDEDAEAETEEDAEDEEDDEDETVQHSAEDPTVQEIIDSMTVAQQNIMSFLIGAALDSAAGSGSTMHTDNTDAEGDLTHKEGNKEMARNVFDQSKEEKDSKTVLRHYISPEDRDSILKHAKQQGETLKSAVEAYALQHNIENIDLLFPDARSVMDRPEWLKRRTEWVQGVLDGTNHTPFSRIKSLSADLTVDEARAKGYVKGNLKKEQFFALTKRTTGPSTIYKKQKLDRDDIVDITDFDVVAWLKVEMRFQLEEELARAILVGDGRAIDGDDKIPDPAGASSGNGIRSIYSDDDLYAAQVFVNVDDANSNYNEVVDALIAARRLYKGSGQPTFYTTEPVITNFLLLRDTTGRRMFRTIDDLAAELRVAAVVPCEAMETVDDLLGIMVNLVDYTIGADRGGEVNMFDDFDIDYNQFKYLIETRVLWCSHQDPLGSGPEEGHQQCCPGGSGFAGPG